VRRVPAPADTRAAPPRALIFDSFYDQYLGIVAQFRVMDGTLSKQDTVTFMNTGRSHAITDLWVRAPDRVDVDSLSAGEVGCLAGAIKTVQVPASHTRLMHCARAPHASRTNRCSAARQTRSALIAQCSCLANARGNTRAAERRRRIGRASEAAAQAVMLSAVACRTHG
jgi:hypothetical protein